MTINYEQEVINAAREGLLSANVVMTAEMEKLFRVIYKAGYQKGRLDVFQSERGKWD